MCAVLTAAVLAPGRPAHADPVCGTAAECNRLIRAAQARLTELGGGGAGWGPVVRDPEGRVRTANQRDAAGYCAGQNARLPTARELAAISASLGGGFLRETAHPHSEIHRESVSLERSQMEAAGYAEILAEQPRGTGGDVDVVVDFYFPSSNPGYRPPPGRLDRFCFWSSSLRPAGDKTGPRAYVLNGRTGAIEAVDPNDAGVCAVRCAAP